jgi:hypothetical protein
LIPQKSKIMLHLALWAWFISLMHFFLNIFHRHPLVFRHLGWFLRLDIVNRASITKSMQVSVLYLHSFAYMHWSGMSLILFMWCIMFFINVCWTIFTSMEWNQSWCMIF